MEIKIGIYHTTNNDGARLDLHTRQYWDPGDDGYPGFNPAWPGEPDMLKHGRERVWNIERRGALYFPTDTYMFESDIIAYLERKGYEYEEAEGDG